MGSRMGGTPERPALFFDGPGDFREWLAQHHATDAEVWTGLYKKHAAERGLTYAQALREALCFGWIDSTEQHLDPDAVRLRWSPRRPGSNWSEPNLALADELAAAGLMEPAGIAALERARADPQAAQLRAQVASGRLPEEYERQLASDPTASRFFYQQAPASYRTLCISWVCGAKRQDTRDRRAAELVAACAEGRVIKPLSSAGIPAWARRRDEPQN